MFGPLSNRESLRDLIVALDAHHSKYYHLEWSGIFKLGGREKNGYLKIYSIVYNQSFADENSRRNNLSFYII